MNSSLQTPPHPPGGISLGLRRKTRLHTNYVGGNIAGACDTTKQTGDTDTQPHHITSHRKVHRFLVLLRSPRSQMTENGVQERTKVIGRWSLVVRPP